MKIGSTRKPATPKDVDEYIAAAPIEARAKLVQMRKIVRSAAPKADESINYKMPYYKYHGALVGFAAFKSHIGLYGTVQGHARDLKGYKTSAGTVQFPLDKPLPSALIEKLVKARVKKNEAKKR